VQEVAQAGRELRGAQIGPRLDPDRALRDLLVLAGVDQARQLTLAELRLPLLVRGPGYRASR